tara:strand:- start:151 stop:423 length:273 start_codon:yes stop_codon:yes gene_type:complete
MYKIRFYRKARDYLNRIQKEERDFILSEIDKLKINPYSNRKLRPLKGYKKLWKYYMKDSRAIVNIIVTKKKILVLTIGHRGDVYSDFFKR